MNELAQRDIDRIIEMAWEDRTTFDAIRQQFGLTPGEVIALMRTHMTRSSFEMWRKRTQGRSTKHLHKRNFKFGRFRSSNQKG